MYSSVPFTQPFVQSLPRPYALNPLHPLCKGLRVWYDPVANINLVSKRPCVATGTLPVPHTLVPARGFDLNFGFGSTDGIELQNTAPLTWPYRSHLCWFYLSSSYTSAFPRIIDSTSNTEAIFFDPGTTSLNYQITWNAGAIIARWYITAPVLNTWHCFQVSYDGTSSANTPILLLDGMPKPVTTSTSASGGTTLDSSSNNYFLGNREDNARNWTGYLGPYLNWDRILRQKEMQDAYMNTYEMLMLNPFSLRMKVPTPPAAGPYKPGLWHVFP